MASQSLFQRFSITGTEPFASVAFGKFGSEDNLLAQNLEQVNHDNASQAGSGTSTVPGSAVFGGGTYDAIHDPLFWALSNEQDIQATPQMLSDYNTGVDISLVDRFWALDEIGMGSQITNLSTGQIWLLQL